MPLQRRWTLLDESRSQLRMRADEGSRFPCPAPLTSFYSSFPIALSIVGGKWCYGRVEAIRVNKSVDTNEPALDFGSNQKMALDTRLMWTRLFNSFQQTGKMPRLPRRDKSELLYPAVTPL